MVGRFLQTRCRYWRWVLICCSYYLHTTFEVRAFRSLREESHVPKTFKPPLISIQGRKDIGYIRCHSISYWFCSRLSASSSTRCHLGVAWNALISYFSSIQENCRPDQELRGPAPPWPDLEPTQALYKYSSFPFLLQHNPFRLITRIILYCTISSELYIGSCFSFSLFSSASVQ